MGLRVAIKERARQIDQHFSVRNDVFQRRYLVFVEVHTIPVPRRLSNTTPVTGNSLEGFVVLLLVVTVA